MEDFNFEEADGHIKVITERMNCRNCRFFIRVPSGDEEGLGVCKRRGFCAIGKEGFQLFTSTNDCDNWSYSKYNDETTRMENVIEETRYKYLMASTDHRTKIYRSMQDFYKSLDCNKKDYSFLSRFGYFIEHDMADCYTKALLAENLAWLRGRKHMTEKNYKMMMNRIQMEIFDKIEPLLDDEDPTWEICKEGNERWD